MPREEQPPGVFDSCDQRKSCLFEFCDWACYSGLPSESGNSSRLGSPNEVPPREWASKHNRTARAYVLGPIVEPRQDRYLQTTLQQKERRNISIKEPFHDSRIR